MIEVAPILELLRRWGVFAQRDFVVLPAQPAWGVYGTGYNNWGVQTQQKYMAAMAVLGSAAAAEVVSAAEREQACTCALQALRYTLATHRSGSARLVDGTQWGHTWISALGLERMMFGVAALAPQLTAADQADLDRVLASEADWIAHRHVRGQTTGVVAGRWAAEGRNAPESNIWNGALLWRTAARLPDHPQAAVWREQAQRFLINGVSVAADAADETVIAGKKVRDWTAGDNFFPHYALDHHAYLNVGYMAICVSNAALLHFDLKAAGQPRTAALDHHQADLWRVLRRMIFDDGRLARIGGDSRVRYCYCQDYLLPALLYATDQLGDSDAPALAAAQLRLIQQEADHNQDGGFFTRRLATLRTRSNYYYCRLESDRACALAMAAWHAGRVREPERGQSRFESRFEPAGWAEPEHGAALHRGPTRLASFAWRAHGLTQGLCQPPQDGHLAEWEQNLAGRIEFQAERATRKVETHAVAAFPGGFLTSGAVLEGAEAAVAEGWQGGPLARHRIVFCALPDGHTVVGLQHCAALETRVFPRTLGGLQFHLPNDLYNGFARTLTGAQGRRQLTAPAATDDSIDLGSRHACIDDAVGLCGLYGAETLTVERRARRRGGAFESLFVESFYWGYDDTPAPRWPGQTLLDCGWAVIATVDGARLARFATENPATSGGDGLAAAAHAAGLRQVTVKGLDGARYTVTAAFGSAPLPVQQGGTLLAATASARVARDE